MLTVLGAVCIYVLLGLSFAFVFEAVGDLGSQPFFASQEMGMLSYYMYFSFITTATVGYDDLTPEGGLGRALVVTEGFPGISTWSPLSRPSWATSAARGRRGKRGTKRH